MTIPTSPVYCKNCGSRNSWQRQPAQDIMSESGKVLWERWRCKICGATTITSVITPAQIRELEKSGVRQRSMDSMTGG